MATQAKSQRGLKIIHRLVQSLWSLIQSYLVVLGGAGATKSSAQDGFWPDIALWTLWPTVHWATGPCIVQGREEELLYFTPRVLIMHRASGRLHAAASGPRSPAPPQPSTRQPSIGDKVDDMSVCSGDCGH